MLRNWNDIFNNIFNTLKNFLSVFFLLFFFIMLIIKIKVHDIKRNIRDIDNKILLLEKEISILNIEFTYLTTPDRLKNIYSSINDIDRNYLNMDILNTDQIKDIKNLIPYYYVKVNSSGSVARK